MSFSLKSCVTKCSRNTAHGMRSHHPMSLIMFSVSQSRYGVVKGQEREFGHNETIFFRTQTGGFGVIFFFENRLFFWEFKKIVFLGGGEYSVCIFCKNHSESSRVPSKLPRKSI